MPPFFVDFEARLSQNETMETMVFGAGYVGLVQAAGLASTGNHVVLADISKERINELRAGKCPIYEPQLQELLQKAVQDELLQFVLVDSPEHQTALNKAEILFIAVQTPERSDRTPNLDYVFSVVDNISTAKGDLSDRIVVIKSTVPVGTGDKVEARFQEQGKRPVVASNPEFLKQGSAVQDFLKPERVIIGTDDASARDRLGFLYQAFMRKQDRIIFTSRRSSELVKYACNTFLAMKISFINEIAQLAETESADIREIRQGLITDSRIGDQFLFPGVGFGGSCFPKDTVGIISQGDKAGVDMQVAKAVATVNEKQRYWAFDRLQDFYPKVSGLEIGLWGLSFKPNTDDLREAPAIYLIKRLIDQGAKVKAHDPVAMKNAQKALSNFVSEGSLQLMDKPYDAAQGSDALIVMTEWHDYRSPNFNELKALLKRPVLIDGRNLYGPEIAARYGFEYRGVGISTAALEAIQNSLSSSKRSVVSGNN